jgi:hypothetical protein
MRLLVVTRHFAALRNYESVIRGLVARGHDVEVAALQDDALGGSRMVSRWQGELLGLRVSWAPGQSENGTETVTQKVRLALDWIRYLAPAYRSAPRLVERAYERTPRVVLWLTKVPGARTAPVRRMLTTWLRGLERALPRVPAVEAFLKERCPDVVMLTPLIGLGSPEVDFLRSAKALGLRTLFGVWSWDNLSSKALIRSVPDIITVWNPTQRTEAVELHGVPPERVVVTGAQCFDLWFDRKPRGNRAEFCNRVGLPPEPPFLLYVCSALFRGSPVEAKFVSRWLTALRESSHERLREVPVLVRPHPSRLKAWDDVKLEGLGPVVLWGRNPIDVDTKADYFDSLSYCGAVVGLNTSAFLEAAIAGRPVFTLLLREFQENQEQTLHFPYLMNVGGGLLHATRTMDEHLSELSEALASPGKYAERSVKFVEAFLRPNGRNEAATPRMISTIERLALAQARRAEIDKGDGFSRSVLAALEIACKLRLTRSLFWDPLKINEERARTRTIREHRRMKRRKNWQAQLDRAKQRSQDHYRKVISRRAKEQSKIERRREKRRKMVRKRRERLQATIANLLRRAIGGQGD